jgi:hypothetical protein
MRCRRAQKYISEQVDGILGPGPEASLKRHLEGCADCRAVFRDLQAIAGRAKELEKLTPPDRVWLKIRAGLREHRTANAAQAAQFEGRRPVISLGSPRFRLALASTLALLVVAAGLFYFHPWRQAVPAVPVEKAALGRQTLQKLDEAEWHYQQAIKALAEAAAARQGRLDPRLAQVFRVNLEIVDASIQTCRQAVLRDPRDLQAQNALLLSYKDKVDILREMLSVPSSSIPAKKSGITL